MQNTKRITNWIIACVAAVALLCGLFLFSACGDEEGGENTNDGLQTGTYAITKVLNKATNENITQAWKAQSGFTVTLTSTTATFNKATPELYSITIGKNTVINKSNTTVLFRIVSSTQFTWEGPGVVVTFTHESGSTGGQGGNEGGDIDPGTPTVTLGKYQMIKVINSSGTDVTATFPWLTVEINASQAVITSNPGAANEQIQRINIKFESNAILDASHTPYTLLFGIVSTTRITLSGIGSTVGYTVTFDHVSAVQIPIELGTYNIFKVTDASNNDFTQTYAYMSKLSAVFESASQVNIITAAGTPQERDYIIPIRFAGNSILSTESNTVLFNIVSSTAVTLGDIPSKPAGYTVAMGLNATFEETIKPGIYKAIGGVEDGKNKNKVYPVIYENAAFEITPDKFTLIRAGATNNGLDIIIMNDTILLNPHPSTLDASGEKFCDILSPVQVLGYGSTAQGSQTMTLQYEGDRPEDMPYLRGVYTIESVMDGATDITVQYTAAKNTQVTLTGSTAVFNYSGNEVTGGISQEIKDITFTNSTITSAGQVLFNVVSERRLSMNVAWDSKTVTVNFLLNGIEQQTLQEGDYGLAYMNDENGNTIPASDDRYKALEAYLVRITDNHWFTKSQLDGVDTYAGQKIIYSGDMIFYRDKDGNYKESAQILSPTQIQVLGLSDAYGKVVFERKSAVPAPNMKLGEYRLKSAKDPNGEDILISDPRYKKLVAFRVQFTEDSVAVSADGEGMTGYKVGPVLYMDNYVMTGDANQVYSKLVERISNTEFKVLNLAEASYGDVIFEWKSDITPVNITLGKYVLKHVKDAQGNLLTSGDYFDLFNANTFKLTSDSIIYPGKDVDALTDVFYIGSTVWGTNKPMFEILSATEIKFTAELLGPEAEYFSEIVYELAQ